MNAQEEWLLEFVQFYRKLDFFKEDSNLSDQELAQWLMQFMSHQGIDLNQSSCRKDYLLLEYDRQRTWGTAFDSYDFYKVIGLEYGCSLHEEIVNDWATISRGFFLPQDVKATWKNEQEPIKIDFTISEITYNLRLDADPSTGVSFIYAASTLTKLADAINPLIENSGHHFAVWDLGCAAIVILLTAEERSIIEVNRGFSFL